MGARTAGAPRKASSSEQRRMRRASGVIVCLNSTKLRARRFQKGALENSPQKLRTESLPSILTLSSESPQKLRDLCFLFPFGISSVGWKPVTRGEEPKLTIPHSGPVRTNHKRRRPESSGSRWDAEIRAPNLFAMRSCAGGYRSEPLNLPGAWDPKFGRASR